MVNCEPKFRKCTCCGESLTVKNSKQVIRDGVVVMTLCPECHSEWKDFNATQPRK